LPILFLAAFSARLSAQMPPPGYERERLRMEERMKIQPLDRDSLTVIDTAVVFDPVNYESETIIVHTRYSLRDYCKNILGIQNPDMLLDGKPHKIVDPKTYGDLIIRLNPAGRIDTSPRME
jgi:hypothetical protein